jgi:DNA polymerase-3 subunit delta
VSRSSRSHTDGLNYKTFCGRIKERDIDQLYLLIGEEVYLQEKALELLYDTLGEGGKVFNLSIYSIGSELASGAKTTIASVIDAANQLPMMAERRIVTVRDFEKLNEHDQEILSAYLQRPSPGTTLVFQAISLDKRRKLTSELMKACTVVAFEPLDEREAKEWAAAYLKRRECTASQRVLELIMRLVGTSLMTLSRELDKLADWAGDGEITTEAVEALVPRASEHTSWELWDAIIRGDRRMAIRLMQRLLEDGESGTPLMVVGALASLYRKLLAGKELLQKGASSGEVARATGQYGYRAGPFNAWLARTPRERIVRGLKRIAEVDNAIKNSEGTPGLQMQYLIAELTQGSAGPRRSEPARPASGSRWK